MTVYNVIEEWLSQPQISLSTQDNYMRIIRYLCRGEFINTELTCDEFVDADHQLIINDINDITTLSTSTKQTRVNIYLSLVSFMADKIGKRFIRPDVSRLRPSYMAHIARGRKSLSVKQWQLFISELKKISIRDALIARCFMGSLYITATLNARLDKVNFERRCIKYGHGMNSFVVYYPSYFMDEIKEYINHSLVMRGESPLLFVTRNGKRITRSRLNYAFGKASEAAGISRVTPYMCRATFIERVEREGLDQELFL